MNNLEEFLASVKDNRSKYGKIYQAEPIIAAIMLGKLCGKSKIKTCWRFVKLLPLSIHKALGFKDRFPCYQTFLNVMESLDIDDSEQAISHYMAKHSDKMPNNIKSLQQRCLDGKSLRGSTDSNGNMWHLVSAFCPDDYRVSGQVKSEKGGGEIIAASNLLDNIDIKGKVFTGDAMFAQSRLCNKIDKEGGYYVFTVKGNQKKLHEAIQNMFDIYPWYGAQGVCHTEVEKEHGRIESRSIEVMCPYVPLPKGFKTVKHISHITRRRNDLCGGDSTTEIYNITNLPAQLGLAESVLGYNREHWGVENLLHRNRDSVFDEDRSRLRTGNVPQLNACLSNAALYLLKRVQDIFASKGEKMSLLSVTDYLCSRFRKALSLVLKLFAP